MEDTFSSQSLDCVNMNFPSRLESYKDGRPQITPCCTIMFCDNDTVLSSVSRSLLAIPQFVSTFHEQSTVSWISPIRNSITCIPMLRRRQNNITKEEGTLITCPSKLEDIFVPKTSLTIPANQRSSFNSLLYGSSMAHHSSVRFRSDKFPTPTTSPDEFKTDRANEYTNESLTAQRIDAFETKTPIPEIASLKRKATMSPLSSLCVVTGGGNRLGCACKKSKCLKRYCECFAGQLLCSEQACKCVSCSNRNENSEQRRQAMNTAHRKDILLFEKQPPSRTKRDGIVSVTKSNGRISCRCKRSRCVMKYCDCFSVGTQCGESCSCSGCRNHE
jgi:Tesmin/TSO1-like CXC domain, cysteine-rich domain